MLFLSYICIIKIVMIAYGLYLLYITYSDNIFKIAYGL